MIWSELNELIDSNQTFAITSHVGLDGDSVGSQLAFCWYLQTLGKSCTIFDSDPVPMKFRFLKNWTAVTSAKPDKPVDVLVVLDCSNPDRMGWKGYRELARTCVNIDHHRDNTHFADMNFVDDKASATAQILYRYFTERSMVLPVDIAECLYMAIMTDTGGFRFSNTNATVLRICSELASIGARCSEIYRSVYDSHSRSGLMLWSRVWSTLQFHHDGRVCTLEMPLDLVEELGATYSDSEGMADFTVMARGVDVGIFIKHRGSETHFSLRSRGPIDVGRIAQKVAGGGGHGNAAGCTLYQPVAQAKAIMLEAIGKELAQR